MAAKSKKNSKKRSPDPEMARAMKEPALGPSFESVRSLTSSDANKSGVEPGVSSKVGISWGNPTFPIFFWLKVNGQVMPPPHFGENGLRVIDVVLKKGENILDWGIKHTAQGWKNQVWVQVAGNAPTLLREDSDPSPGSGDDLSTAAGVTVRI